MPCLDALLAALDALLQLHGAVRRVAAPGHAQVALPLHGAQRGLVKVHHHLLHRLHAKGGGCERVRRLRLARSAPIPIHDTIACLAKRLCFLFATHDARGWGSRDGCWATMGSFITSAIHDRAQCATSTNWSFSDLLNNLHSSSASYVALPSVGRAFPIGSRAGLRALSRRPHPRRRLRVSISRSQMGTRVAYAITRKTTRVAPIKLRLSIVAHHRYIGGPFGFNCTSFLLLRPPISESEEMVMVCVTPSHVLRYPSPPAHRSIQNILRVPNRARLTSRPVFSRSASSPPHRVSSRPRTATMAFRLPDLPYAYDALEVRCKRGQLCVTSGVFMRRERAIFEGTFDSRSAAAQLPARRRLVNARVLSPSRMLPAALCGHPDHDHSSHEAPPGV